ncbi:kinase-like protein [Gigaspora margarita]|uniref:Kinase-like protein n=1 Tax=Gigaspora margarita TaxID=4874 RepID=A0A8H4EVR6_GIGMA|nr:kinase-like protein [Gigaspora margarita]
MSSSPAIPELIIENSHGKKRRHEEDEHDNRKIVKISTSFDCDIEFSELEVIKYISKGGFGIVYQKWWNKGKENEQIVAVKVVPSTNDTKTQQSERDFKREFYGLAQNPQTEEYCLVMQYANDGNLQDYLKEHQHRLDFQAKISLIKPILKGLEFLHDEDIIHRDLHSKNILIHNGNPLLADFGLSKSLLEINDGHISEVRGIQAYVDPNLLSESLNSNYTHTKLSDIYSFGVVMWQIYTCSLPFDGKNSKYLTMQLCFGKREKPVHGMPISYINIYEKCWNHNPSFRYSKISDILKDLHNIEQTPIYSEESKDKSPGSLNQMDTETIIKSPSNVESDSTKGMELSMSISEFFQSHKKFGQLVSDIENSYQAAQLNKKICRELYFCIDNARHNMNRLKCSIQDSNTPVALKDFMLFQQNVRNIKKFIENISNIRGLEIYIQKIDSVITLEKIKYEAAKLLLEFNESMSSLFQKQGFNQTQETEIENEYDEIEETTKAIQCDFKDVSTMFKVIKNVMNQLGNNPPENNEQTIIVNKINGNLQKIGGSIVFCKDFNLNRMKNICTQATFLKSLEGLPNIANFCRIIKAETSPQLIYFAKEWSECGNLKEFISQNGLNFQNKLSFALDICKGLVFLNAVQVLHRDIRSENIIVTNNTAKITNFDVSRLMSGESQKIYINRDNIRYSAPELLKREPSMQDSYDSRCEVYSFGTLIWEILNEKPPYKEYVDINELKEHILRNENADLKNSINKLSQEFSQEYKKIINKALDFERAIRPTICDMFKILHSVVNDDSMIIDERTHDIKSSS